nr:MAG TPA: hypothetical protein [Caudoviricetes sp.]
MSATYTSLPCVAGEGRGGGVKTPRSSNTQHHITALTMQDGFDFI